MLDLVRTARLATLIVSKRLEVTGHPMTLPDFSIWPAEILDAPTFSALVTECYKWVRESWQQDVKFLSDQGRELGVEAQAVRDLVRNVGDLRTANQHSGNADAVRQSQRWFRDSCGSASPNTTDEWAVCGVRVMNDVERALEELVGLVRAVSAEPSAAAGWTRMAEAAVANDPLVERDVVAADLGLAVPRNRLAYVDRQIEWQWQERQRVLTTGDDAMLELTRIVERFLIGWSLTTLPCHYNEVLDRVNVEPGPDALAAIRLAHVLADLLEYDSVDEFLAQFEAVWRVLSERAF